MNFHLSQGLPLYWRQTWSGTRRNTQRHRRISEWRWRLLRVHYTRLAGLARSGGGKRREHVHLHWKGQEPPAAAPLALKLKWTTLFSYRFLTGKHINLLELESLIVLLRRIAREGIPAQRLLVLVDSRVVLEAVSEGRSSSRKINFSLRKIRFWCLAWEIALELVWVHTWANLADAASPNKPIVSWYATLPKLPPSPTAVLASARALSELDLLREPLLTAAHTAGVHVRELESPGAFSCSEMKLRR